MILTTSQLLDLLGFDVPWRVLHGGAAEGRHALITIYSNFCGLSLSSRRVTWKTRSERVGMPLRRRAHARAAARVPQLSESVASRALP
jgi:hypothetical protein